MTWDWQFFTQDIGTGQTYLDWLWSAWGWTLSVAGCSLALALAAGSIIGTLRTLPNHRWIVLLGNAWVELFRDIPLLVQIFIWYFVIPALIPPLKQVPGFLLVVCALGFFTSARIAEQVRAGIQALPRGQGDAARALGFKTWQTYRYVLLPMAFRIILPPLTSESMNIVKNSSVAFAVSIPELSLYAMQVVEETQRFYEVYLAVTVLYVITAFAVNRVLAFIEKHTRIPGFIASSGAGAH